jgi:AAHS family 4-hydroxybenzoate transporter-like MFS transporter
MLALAAASVAGCVLLAIMPISTEAAFSVLTMLTLTGGFINATQTTMYALAANVYPTSIRATGVGTAVAFGRIGGVLSPVVGAWALDGGPSRYFLVIAATMTMTFVALASVRRHVPGSAVQTAPSMAAAPARH